MSSGLIKNPNQLNKYIKIYNNCLQIEKIFKTTVDSFKTWQSESIVSKRWNINGVTEYQK